MNNLLMLKKTEAFAPVIYSVYYNNPQFPAVDGNWGEWDSWSPCSVDCGPGHHARRRHCDDPAPSLSGKQCLGRSEETEECLIEECRGQ